MHSYTLIHYCILSQYCVIVIACVILPYNVHTPCMGSIHAIFTMYCTAMLCGFLAFISCSKWDPIFPHKSRTLVISGHTHTSCVCHEQWEVVNAQSWVQMWCHICTHDWVSAAAEPILIQIIVYPSLCHLISSWVLNDYYLASECFLCQVCTCTQQPMSGFVH